MRKKSKKRVDDIFLSSKKEEKPRPCTRKQIFIEVYRKACCAQ
jgi:hypothetical protein